MVDDEAHILEVARLHMERQGPYEVDTVVSGVEALQRTRARNYDVIVSDYDMPAMNGAELLRQMRSQGDSTPFIIITSRGKESVALDCQHAGADRYMQRSGSSEDWLAALMAEIDILTTQQCPARASSMAEETAEESLQHLLQDGLDGSGRSSIPAAKLIPKVDAQDLYSVKNIIHAVMGDSEPRTTQFRVHGPQGAVWHHGIFLPDGEGSVQVSMKCIHAQRCTLLEGKALWDMLTGALEMAPLHLEMIDGDWNMLYSNRYPPLEDKCHRVIKGREAPCPDCGLKQSMDDGSIVRQTFLEGGQDTEVMYIPSIDHEGRTKGVLRLQQEALEPKSSDQILETVLETNRKLHLLTSIIRHDILNQLTAMMGYLDLYDEVPEKQDLVMSRMRELVRNVDRQVTFTRSYQQLGSTAPSWQDCQECIRNAMQELDIDQGMVSVDSPLPLVFGDQMLERVLVNLFANSLMHGGGIRRIRVWFQESEEGGSLFIADDGRGVPEDKKERIFDRGYGDNSGYGLFLVRSILDITGITIKEVGVPGQGACFRMDLPRKIYAFKNDRGEQK